MMKILNFGSLNIDNVYKVDHMVRKGETLLSSGREVFTGGKGLNQSVALGRAGLNVFHAGSIGTDGVFLLDELKKANVDVSNVTVLPDTPSGHTIIQNDNDGDNCILLFGGANQAITKEQVDRVIAGFDAGDYLVLQNEVNELAYIMTKAREAGLKIVLNPSPMDEKIAQLPLSCVDLFMLNEIEAGQLTGCVSGEADDLLKGIKDKFPGASVVLTLGADGSVYSDGEKTVRQGIYKVKAVDTTAAGDTFTGYFLAGMLTGKSVEESLSQAARASSITVSRAGAAPSIPTKEEVEAAIRAEQ
jgi:ribokinase